MNTMGKILGIIIFGFVGVTSGIIYKTETIPDNAKIWVYPSQQAWSPDSWFMDREFEQQLEDAEQAASIQRWLDDRRPATYSDVKDGGVYAGYEAFPALLEEPGNIMRGWNGSLLRSWFLKRPRWNDDGSWNW